MIDFTLPLRRTGEGTVAIFEISRSIHNDFWKYINEVGARTSDHFRVRIDRPFRPRTTGPRSQSARFRGHCEDLSEQVLKADGSCAFTPHQIAEAMKRMSVEDGYPTHMTLDGIEECDSEASLSVEQENILLRKQQQYADAHDYWLTEYSEEKCEECGGYGLAQHSDDCSAGLGQPCDCRAQDKKCPVCHGKKIILTPFRSVHGRTRAEMELWNRHLR